MIDMSFWKFFTITFCAVFITELVMQGNVNLLKYVAFGFAIGLALFVVSRL
jgi:inner membrane protein involved in colicin E2 resistance